MLLVARRADELERVRDRILVEGGRAESYACDLTDADAVDGLVRWVVEEHGGVDGLVNNAGRSIRRSLVASYERVHDVERTLDLNFVAPVRLTLGLLPGMVERGEGRVVNVLTWGVQVKAPKFSAYIASKTALDVVVAHRRSRAVRRRRDVLQRPAVAGADPDDRSDRRLPPRARAEPGAGGGDRRARPGGATAHRRHLAGRVAEVLNLALPRLSDLAAWAGSRAFPDSPAAVRHLEPEGASEAAPSGRRR